MPGASDTAFKIRELGWPIVDAYRALCIATWPEVRVVFESIGEFQAPA
jgi:hypothetical protein